MAYTRDYRYHTSRARREYTREDAEGFTCRHCGAYVPGASPLAGVQNRNHCPYCLWSRHLDGRTAGDRASGCRASMRPLGLTAKRSANKYAAESDGELMVVHRCTVCAKVVANRIAADDSDAALLEVFAGGGELDAAARAELADAGVALLTDGDRALVRRRLYGAAGAVRRGRCGGA